MGWREEGGAEGEGERGHFGEEGSFCRVAKSVCWTEDGWSNCRTGGERRGGGRCQWMCVTGAGEERERAHSSIGPRSAVNWHLQVHGDLVDPNTCVPSRALRGKVCCQHVQSAPIGERECFDLQACSRNPIPRRLDWPSTTSCDSQQTAATIPEAGTLRFDQRKKNRSRTRA